MKKIILIKETFIKREWLKGKKIMRSLYLRDEKVIYWKANAFLDYVFSEYGDRLRYKEFIKYFDEWKTNSANAYDIEVGEQDLKQLLNENSKWEKVLIYG